jgi:hypothetical protein
MPFTVTQRKRGGFEYTSVAETQSAALVLAQMMRRAGDEYCTESAVTVQSSNGAIVSAWRGGTYGWQPVPQARPAAEEGGLQPLHAPRAAAGPARQRPSSRFARLPTDPMQSQSQVSMSRGSYASISITDYSAISIA